MIKSRPLTSWFRLANDLKTHQLNINDKFGFLVGFFLVQDFGNCDIHLRNYN